jgi:hypothetical protein
MGIRRIVDANTVVQLVNDLTGPIRSKPLCLISTEFNSKASQFDLHELEAELGSIAELVLIETGPATFALADQLPPGLQVFGGAARVYPINFKLDTSEHLPLIYPDNAGTKALISKVWAYANISALKTEQVRNASEKRATVRQVFVFEQQSRVVVELEDGSTATIRQELTFQKVPFDWIFSVGDKVSGLHDVESASFSPILRFTKSQELLDDYELEALVPVLVTSVERKRAACCLFPGINIDITLPEISGNELDLVSDFLVAGDVVAMRIYKNPQGKISLRMNDIDDDEVCRPAVSIFSNGPAWLVEGKSSSRGVTATQKIHHQVTASTSISQYLDIPVTEIPTPKPKPGTYVATPTPVDAKPVVGRAKSDFEFEIRTLKDRVIFLTGSVEALARERDGLFAELARAAHDLDSKSNEISSLKQTATSLRRAGAKQSSNKSTVSSRRDRFSSDDGWFSEELRRVWISTYAPSDRTDRFPLHLSKFDYSNRFFASLKISQCDDNDLKKVLRCVLDIVTGREIIEPRHQVHTLREGSGASNQDVVAEDGSVALRAYVEEKTAAAKRLHYWMSPSKQITLERVVSHDDVQP